MLTYCDMKTGELMTINHVTGETLPAVTVNTLLADKPALRLWTLSFSAMDKAKTYREQAAFSATDAILHLSRATGTPMECWEAVSVRLERY